VAPQLKNPVVILLNDAVMIINSVEFFILFSIQIPHKGIYSRMKRSTPTSQGASKKKKTTPTMERDALDEITTNDTDATHLNGELQSPSSTGILSTIHSGMEWFNHLVFGHSSTTPTNTIQQEVPRHDIDHSPPITTNIESDGIDQDFAQYMIRKRIDPSKFTQLDENTVANFNAQERILQREFEECFIHTDIRFEFAPNTISTAETKVRNIVNASFLRYMNLVSSDPRYDVSPTQTYELRRIEGVFSIDDFRSISVTVSSSIHVSILLPLFFTFIL
jgi:hypothetical protein